MPTHFSLDYYDPPPELGRHILTTFCFETENILLEDRHPGALGQLVLFPSGEGGITFGDRFDPAGPGVYAFSGFSSATPMQMQGPWRAIGASLSPLGWAALTNRHAGEHFDRFYPAEELLGPEIAHFAHDLNRRFLADEIEGKAACDELTDWIAPRLSTVSSSHEKLIESTIGWLGSSLNPEMERLFSQLTYSRRQAERLVERYFGLPPAALARKFRAVRAAALLSKQDLSDEAESEIALAFHDQPHMIREIRCFCGYTPTRLGGPQDPLFHTMIQMKNLDRLKEFRAIE